MSLPGARDHRACFDRLGVPVCRVRYTCLLGTRWRIGLSPRVKLLIPVAHRDGRLDPVLGSHLFDRLASRRECGLGRGIREQQPSVVRDHHVVRHGGRDLPHDVGAAKSSEHLIKHAAPVLAVQFGLQSPILIL